VSDVVINVLTRMGSAILCFCKIGADLITQRLKKTGKSIHAWRYSGKMKEQKIGWHLNWSTLKSCTSPEPLCTNSSRGKGNGPPVEVKRGSRISLNLPLVWDMRITQR
jgi:hypothetical protein